MPKCSGIYLGNIQKSIAKASKSVSTRFLPHATPRRFGTLFFEVLLFTDTASVVNGKISKKSMQKPRLFFWCVKTLNLRIFLSERARGVGLRNTKPFNLTGHPSLSINAGCSEGLPIGMMMTGKHFDETTLLQIAYAWEQLRDGK